MCLKEERFMNKKYAILVVDMLNDFVTGVIGCDRAKTIVKPTKELLDEARKIMSLLFSVMTVTTKALITN